MFNVEIAERLASSGIANSGLAHNGMGVYRSGDTYTTATQSRKVEGIQRDAVDLLPDLIPDEFTLVNQNSNLEYVFSDYPSFISFSQDKRIVETPINDGDSVGVVVERISNLPVSIKIQGILVDMDNHQYPHAKVAELYEVFNVNDILEVSSDLFDSVGIESLYTQKISIKPVAKFPDTVSYSIDAKAHTPIDLLLED